MERKFIRERQQAGIEAAKAKGVYKGRKPSMPAEKVRQMRAAGHGPSTMAKALGTSRMSVHRVLTEARGGHALHLLYQRAGPVHLSLHAGARLIEGWEHMRSGHITVAEPSLKM